MDERLETGIKILESMDIDDFVTLNHEIFHCTILILKRIGVSLSDDSEEAYAYLYEYITKMIYSKTTKFSSSSSR